MCRKCGTQLKAACTMWWTGVKYLMCSEPWAQMLVGHLTTYMTIELISGNDVALSWSLGAWFVLIFFSGLPRTVPPQRKCSTCSFPLCYPECVFSVFYGYHEQPSLRWASVPAHCMVKMCVTLSLSLFLPLPSS